MINADTATVINTPTMVISTWWKQLAYRHKSAEFLLYLMFISGVLLWDRIELSWQISRWLLPAHMLIGATLFSIIVGAFWSSHRKLLVRSKKSFLRQTGTAVEWLLVVCTLSGFYLFFYGNTGSDIGQLLQDIHFYSSWLLAPLVFRHALRWSILNFKK
jgi:hypothetical protein